MQANLNAQLPIDRTLPHKSSPDVQLCAPACSCVHPCAENKIFLANRSQLHISSVLVNLSAQVLFVLFCAIQCSSALFSALFYWSLELGISLVIGAWSLVIPS